MIPTHTLRPTYRGQTFLATYLRRIVKPKQMDFEATFWLLSQLLLSPKKAYRNTSYHKQTKNQWARDDPAFVVVISCLLALSALAYCITYGEDTSSIAWTVISAVAIDFLLIGCAISTVGWFLANHFLKKKQVHHHTVEQNVEWFYAFDVHCNSYFPMFVVLYLVQFLLSPLLLWNSFLAAVLSNVLYVVGLSYYHYMNFLGYSALPFLNHTEVFLWPIGLIFLAMPFAILTGFNPTRFTLGIYFG